jgi:hypothetical protein
MEFMVDIVAVGRYPQYLCVVCQFSFRQMLYSHVSPSEAGIVGPVRAGLPILWAERAVWVGLNQGRHCVLGLCGLPVTDPEVPGL